MFAETTKVPAGQTRAELEKLAMRHEATQFLTGSDHESKMARVQFRAQGRIVRFTVPLPGLPDPKKAAAVRRYEQEERRVWRALLLVVKAKFESVDSGIETFEAAFLAQVVMPNDRTVVDIITPQIADAYKTGKMPKALGPGDGQ